MGLIGIVLLVAAISLAGFIILDTKLGSPPRPKTIIVLVCIMVIGIGLIVSDYKIPPTVQKVELTTSDMEIEIDKKTAKLLNKPIKLKIIRDVYPWYSIFNRNRIKLTISSD
ncbi:MAG: hypothetical protein MUD12_00840 [Spirochaetes bacterium]|jgi:NhaP-type Na+/H+ or K+/H+ antiporter|nr:hypothetical protein [Spirochaetota bacterium]